MVASGKHKWLALALLSVVQFMLVLDIAIVNVALPSIKVDLGFSQENLQWVISAYALVFGGFLLLGGRAADILGRRRMFIGGLVVFTSASLLAALAWNEPSLIGARAIQGLGAAIIAPGPARRRSAIAIFSAPTSRDQTRAARPRPGRTPGCCRPRPQRGSRDGSPRWRTRSSGCARPSRR
jgi:MFS family permease